MIARTKAALRDAWNAEAKRPFATLLRVFLGRVFHGGDAPGAGEMNVGLGVVLILLAMPGTLVSLLLFEKYSSLLRWMRGEGSFDPFTASIPDEYFFIVLSLAVTGAAALWRWDALFLDRRDYTNLVPLPISLRRIFFANFAAIILLAVVLTLDVNAASFFLFPVAVAGSQVSLRIFLRFAAGHAATVALASAFCFFAVFAIIGFLMAVLPHGLFRRVSRIVRFAIGLFLLALLATSFTAPTFLAQVNRISKLAIRLLPPVWFVGLSQTFWGNGTIPAYATLSRTAIFALGAAIVLAFLSYTLSFRRTFVRIPETSEVGPLARSRVSLFPSGLLDRTLLQIAPQRGCFHFVTRTLLRSEAHLQIAAAFAAMGLVVSAQSFASALRGGSLAALRVPSEDLLAIPFLLAFCIIAGIRLAFEIPSDLRANWIFALWIHAENLDARVVARKVLLTASLIPLVPLCFASSWYLWDFGTALLHTTLFAACTAALVEVLLIRFRKIPFTCSPPAFGSNSSLVFAASLFGFLFFTSYLPEFEAWTVVEPWRALLFLPLLAIAFGSVHFYRKQMLDMDKQLIFEESSASSF